MKTKRRLIAALLGVVLGLFLYGVAEKKNYVYCDPLHCSPVCFAEWHSVDWRIDKKTNDLMGVYSGYGPYFWFQYSKNSSYVQIYFVFQFGRKTIAFQLTGEDFSIPPSCSG